MARRCFVAHTDIMSNETIVGAENLRVVLFCFAVPKRNGDLPQAPRSERIRDISTYRRIIVSRSIDSLMAHALLRQETVDDNIYSDLVVARGASCTQPLRDYRE